MPRIYELVELRDQRLTSTWNSRTNQFENDFRREADPSGKGVDTTRNSDPQDAWDASTRLWESHVLLARIRDEMKKWDLTRVWRGPAGKAFREIFTAFTTFLDEAVSAAQEYDRVTKLVHHAHFDKYWGFDPDEFRQILSKARDRGEGTSGVRIADMKHTAYWYDWYMDLYRNHPGFVRFFLLADPTVGTHEWNLVNSTQPLRQWAKEYDERVKNYFVVLETKLADMVTKQEAARDDLAAKYLDYRGQYQVIPLEPNFRAATRLIDPDADDDDTITLDTSGLERALGGLSNIPSSLAGGLPNPSGLGSGLGGSGGGPGLGDMPGLSGGGGAPSPELGGMPGGSGLGDPLGGLGGSGLGGPPVGGGVPGLGASEVGGPGMPLVPGSIVPLAGGGTGRVVTNPDGSKGIDVDGDGRADVGLDAVDGSGSGGGLPLVTGPDGTVGYDLTGNGNPDLAPDLHPLRSGDLPPGSALVVGADGSRAIDIDGDGIPDLTLDGRAIPGTAAPGGRLATGPDGVTGFDLDGDGIPDVGFDGAPLSPDDLQMPDPEGLLPSQQMIRPGDELPGQPLTPMMGGGYPMMPFMPGMGMGGMGGMGAGAGNEKERERQTWLREDEKVWEDDVGTTVASLGRPDDDEDEEIEAPVDAWVRQPRQRRAHPQVPRTVPPRGYQPGTSRR